MKKRIFEVLSNKISMIVNHSSFLFYLFIISIILRITAMFITKTYCFTFGDERSYWNAAMSLFEGGYITNFNHYPTATLVPGNILWIYLLSIPFKDLVFAKVMNIIASSALVFVIFGISKKFLCGKWRFLPPIIYTVYPPLISASCIFYPQSLSIILLSLIVYISIYEYKKPVNIFIIILYGMLLGFLALTVSSVIILTIPFIIQFIKSKRNLLFYLFSLLLFLFGDLEIINYLTSQLS